MKIIILLLFLAFQIKSFGQTDANKIVSIADQLPAVGKYNWVKSDQKGQPTDVFQKYEVSRTKKVIFICLNYYVYNAIAKWDINIKSKKDAEKIAMDYCGDRVDGVNGFVLLGYKINKEIRY